MDVLVWPETDALVAPGTTAPPAIPPLVAGAPLLVAVAAVPLVLAVPPPLEFAAPAMPAPEPAVAAAAGTSPLFTKPTAPSPDSGAGYS
jgi:hypothetical protein